MKILQDSSKMAIDLFRLTLDITFEGEPGLDYGGIKREWHMQGQSGVHQHIQGGGGVQWDTQG